MKIKVLSKQLANMISAGEVVENPASVVKELVENSIDAGANQIKIEITDGGITKIMITDNGCGIEQSEVATAFLAHATSKIHSQNDLEAIQTLGFRGEALASISAVSQIEIITKTSDALVGTKLVIDSGEVQSITETASAVGTKIIVKNLFFNTPARKKFLNTPKIEENNVTKIVERFMLSYPNIKFQYYSNSKEIYSTNGTGLLDNIFLIYGQEVAKNMLQVNYTDGNYTLEGYTSTTDLTKPNRSYQVSFINGRMVKDFYMDNAIQCVYQDYLMHSNFPVCFLNFKVPYDTVDVNIHPTKQEVKYENVREINLFFIKALTHTLEKNHIKKFSDIFASPPIIEEKPENQLFTSFQNNMKQVSENFGSSFKQEEKIEFGSGQPALKNVYLQEEDLEPEDNRSFFEHFEKLSKQTLEKYQQTELEETAKLPKYKIIGVAFSTYIILELNEKLIFIDQHACHERKLYDRMLKLVDENQLAVQKLIFPYFFTVNSTEANVFLDHIEDFKSLGINIKEYGENTFCIDEAPVLFKDLNYKKFIDDLKSNLNQFKLDKKTLLKEFLAKTACKSAVKAGDRLSEEDIEALLADLENHKVLLCPHGRPFVYVVTKRDIEKWFKRIV